MNKSLTNPPPAKVTERPPEDLCATALPIVFDIKTRVMQVANAPSEEEALRLIEGLATDLKPMAKLERDALLVVALRDSDQLKGEAEDPRKVIEYLIATQFSPPAPEVCKQLIESKLFDVCIQDLVAVPTELHTKLAKVCLEDYGERTLASNLSGFVNLEPEIAHELIKRGFVKEVLENQDSFVKLDVKELVTSIFAYGRKIDHRGTALQDEVASLARQVLVNIDPEQERSQILAEEIKKDFTHPFIWKIIDPSREEKWDVVVVDAILAQGEVEATQKYYLKESLSAFNKLPARIAEAFVQDYALALAVANQPEQFTNLTETVALGLVNHKITDQLLANPKIFGGETNAVAEALIELRGAETLAWRLGSWSGLSSDIALRLISDNSDTAIIVLKNLESFEGLGQEQAMALATQGVPGLVDRLDSFKNLDREALGGQILMRAKSEDTIDEFLKNRKAFPEISDELIVTFIVISNWYQNEDKQNHDRKPISAGLVNSLLETIDPANHQMLAIALININQAKDFLVRYNDFQQTNFDLLRQMLLDSQISKDLTAMGTQIDFFPPDKHQEIANRLVLDNQGVLLLNNWDSFQSLNSQEIFDLMMNPDKQLPEWGYPKVVAEHLNKFLDLDHNQVVSKFLETDKAVSLCGRISSLQGLSVETREALIKADRMDVVCSSTASFVGIDQREIVFEAIKSGEGRAVLINVDNLDQVSFSEILEEVFACCRAPRTALEVASPNDLYKKILDYPRQVSMVLNEKRHLPGKFAVALSDPTNIINAHRNNFIDDFPTDEVARYFIRQNHATTLFASHCSFKDFTVDQEFIELLIATEQWRLMYLETDARLTPFCNEDNLRKILESKPGDIGGLLKSRAEFVGVTDERIIELVLKNNLSGQLLSNLEYFDSIPFSATLRLAKEEPAFYVELNKHIEKFGVANQKERASRIGLRLEDYLLVDDIVASRTKLEEDDYRQIYQRLTTISASWSDEVSLPFKEAAEQFGYRSMFAYINRSDVSHHDACFALVDIKNLLNKVNTDAGYNLSNKQLGDLLLQVNQDDATYPEGRSLHHLNSIANRSLEGPQTLKQKVLLDVDLARYDNLQDRLDSFASRSQTLANWRELKVYAEWNQVVVHQAPSLRKVSQLREAGQIKLADYFEAIAFHPGSKVNCEALFEFVEDPKTFLARSDIHAPVKLHNDKKPSNYLAIPHLGLSAEDLRDALVEGNLDKIQILPASEIVYSFANTGLILETDLEKLPIADLLLKTLGSRKADVVGILPERILSQQAAMIQKIIYSAHQKEGRDGGVRLSDVILEGYQPSEETVVQVREHLIQVLHAEKLIDTKPNRFSAKVHLKSSPDAVLAGDDTACCMPFGSGKDNVYKFNPNCVQFTIQQLDEEGKVMRTVAQSVLSLNFDASVPFPELQDSFSSGKRLSEIVPEHTLNHSKRKIVCDSIETNKNFTAQATAIAQLKLMYEDFFDSYVKQLPDVLADGHEVDKSQVRIGKQYAGPFASSYSLLTNTDVPLAPMSYSDNTNQQSYSLDLISHLVTKEERVKVSVSGVTETEMQSRQVSPLTYRDSLMTAYLEGKIYSDNPSLMVSLHTIQNVLIAHDIAKAHREEPNLSFKYQDATRKMKAYLIAYQGEHQSIDEEEKAEPCIYIYDFAAVSTNGVAAGKVLLNFLEQYQQEYLEKGKPLPIYIDARERTSYKLLMNQIKSFEKRLGCKINVEHLGEEMRGAEIMKKIKITPVI